MTRKLAFSSSCLIVLLLLGDNYLVSCDLSLFSSSSSSSSSSQSSLPSTSSGSATNKEHLLDINLNGDSDIDNKYDRLHLFPSSRGFLERSPQETGTQCLGDKSQICKEYCESINLKEATTNEPPSTSSSSSAAANNSTADRLASLFIDKLKCRKMIDDANVKLTGLLRYYKSFVHSFVTSIQNREGGNLEDEVAGASMIYKLEIEISKHEMAKLASFAIADEGGGGGGGGSGVELNETTVSVSIDQVHDVTEILKSMLVQVESNRLLTLTERLIEAFQAVDVFNSPFVRSIFAVIAIAACGFIFWRLNKRLPVYKSWRYFLIFVLFALFVISVYNNHIYLAQKKQIYNQQKLKEFVPDECLAKDVPNPENKGAYSKVMSFIKYHIGYTPTSRRCLEYQEALFIVSGHNNYVESIVYTVSESLKPIFISSGEFINQFYGALTKDLSFWQYIPLITLVTIVLLPIGLIFILVMSLVLFGYEFNFFYNLISFRRRTVPATPIQQRTAAPAIEESRRQKRDELESILGTIRSESSRLVSNNVTLMISDISCMALQSHLIESSSDSANANDLDLVPIDVDNSSEALKKNIHTIFTRINSREYELKHQLDNLRVENYALKERLKSKEEENERQRLYATRTSSTTTRSKPTSSSSSSSKTTATTTTTASIEPLDSSPHDTSESSSNNGSNESATSDENRNNSNSTNEDESNNGETEVESTTTTEVAIGLSKTVAKLTSHQHSGEDDDDDDDEIYVILDDN